MPKANQYAGPGEADYQRLHRSLSVVGNEASISNYLHEITGNWTSENGSAFADISVMESLQNLACSLQQRNSSRRLATEISLIMRIVSKYIL